MRKPVVCLLKRLCLALMVIGLSGCSEREDADRSKNIQPLEVTLTSPIDGQTLTIRVPACQVRWIRKMDNFLGFGRH
ncbi:hypothetical protein FHR87_003617 [Azomonas macrocytogenes]|uniref:Uncharacterized protein n=1 Tax=Azomonas macrocytogenes TaxID=69962 RepID=A0A839T6W1_AZOMA|nr:hypothetical protein [Azomonas macrocytogenes]